MATGVWQGCILRLFVLMYLSKQVSSIDRERICVQLRYCYKRSPMCRIVSNYYNCIEPKCGESTVTGSASKYAMPRIVGGIPALNREFPWTVYISIGCGGTILNKRTVLTAAHCVQAVTQPETLTVGYGSINRSMMINISVSKIIKHPSYDNYNQDYDLAVLKLSSDFPLSNDTNLRGICLPTRRQTYVSGRTCIVTGWGVTTEGGAVIQETMRKAVVPLIPLDQCKPFYEDSDFILVSERQLCAGYLNAGGVDACQSDSGGPLFCADGDQWVLEGVVSTGRGCGRPDRPGVYAFVPQNVYWIQAAMTL